MRDVRDACPAFHRKRRKGPASKAANANRRAIFDLKG